MATINQLPAKSPILDKYRSRLQITYRTNISGTPVPLKLPFRVLVMGDFKSLDQRNAEGLDLRDRKIRSIQMGAADASVPAFMQELTPWMRVPKALRGKLEAPVPGKVAITRLSFPTPAPTDYDATTKEAQVHVTGTASFTSTAADNGVCKIAAFNIPLSGTMTAVEGANGADPTLKAGAVTLALAGAIQGDILDAATGKPTGVLTALFAPGEPAASFSVPDTSKLKLTSSSDGSAYLVTATDPTTTFPAHAVRTMPFQSLDAFSPDAVADSIPELHRLRVLRDLVLELQSTVKNNRDLQKALRAALTPSAANTAAFTGFQAWAKESFPQLLLNPVEAPHA